MEDEPRLTEQQENQLRELFTELDVDESGTLDTKETIYLLRCLGCNPTEEEVQDLMKYCNVDDDTSTLNYEEYRRIVGAKISMDKTSMRENIEKAFDEFDRNGDGKLDKEELREALMSKGGNKMTEEECDDLFDEIDTDGDGKLEKKQLVDRICADFERMCQEGDSQENQGQDEES